MINLVEFCDDCGGMLLSSKDEDGNQVLKCRSCGWTRPIKESDGVEYTVKRKIEHSVREEVQSATAIMKWKDKYLKSVIKDFKCRKCGYDKAALETRQTRSADEGMTHFIICLKCGKMIKIGS